MTSVEHLERNYRAAFLRYLPSQDEAALHAGYEIGRAAVGDGLSILDLAQVHHRVFVEVLADTPPDDLARVGAAASDFFLQVLALLRPHATGLPGQHSGRSIRGRPGTIEPRMNARTRRATGASRHRNPSEGVI